MCEQKITRENRGDVIRARLTAKCKNTVIKTTVEKDRYGFEVNANVLRFDIGYMHNIRYFVINTTSATSDERSGVLSGVFRLLAGKHLIEVNKVQPIWPLFELLLNPDNPIDEMHDIEVYAMPI